ncbi:aminotransferase class I/II-fold pyridoxal phosphate-dependent enzyme [Flindersiella endophytica]
MDHSQAPVLEAVAAFHRRDDLSFTPPGHKQGRGADERALQTLGPDVYAGDLLALNGLDDRQMSGQFLARAQELMADAVDAEQAFFSTCGSSLSVKSAMLAVAGPYEKLIVSRNAHKSVVSGLILAGIDPVWVPPRWDSDQMLAHPPGAEEIEQALRAEPEAKGVLLITPTSYGTCGALRETAEACHRHGRPLVVDEAWGAHLPFHESLPAWAMDAGADVCVTSVHKMGGGLEQGSVFHLQGDLVSADRLKACEDLLGTTSPSVLIYAALDAWRRQMAQRGHELLSSALELSKRLRDGIDRLPGLHPLGDEFVAAGMAAEYDPLMVVVDVQELGTSGFGVSDWLREQRHINAGLADHRHVAFQLTHADTTETVDALLGALRDLPADRAALPPPAKIDLPAPEDLLLEQAILPRDAFFGEIVSVPIEDAVGRIGAELISPYPPGVPVVVPGERINQAVVDYLRSGADAGIYLPDPADPEVRRVQVVAE